jgi:hypothetical protein
MPVRLTLAQPLIPSCDVRHGGSFDFQLEISIQRCSGRDVPHRQAITGEEWLDGQVPIQQAEVIGALRDELIDPFQVALRFGAFDRNPRKDP